MLLSGIAWTVVYVFAIRIGFQQRTYAIPAAALALNIAWETIYASRGLATADVSVQIFVNVAWAVADVLIVYTYLRYGRRELPAFVSRPLFVGWSILIFTTAYIVQWLFVIEFGWVDRPSMQRSCRTCRCRSSSSRHLWLVGDRGVRAS